LASSHQIQIHPFSRALNIQDAHLLLLTLAFPGLSFSISITFSSSAPSSIIPVVGEAEVFGLTLETSKYVTACYNYSYLLTKGVLNSEDHSQQQHHVTLFVRNRIHDT